MLPEQPLLTAVGLRLLVAGQVQGVGFRPLVYRLATALGLCGSVRNEAGRVLIELFGPTSALHDFRQQLLAQLPAQATISALDSEPWCPPTPPRQFEILESRQASGPVSLPIGADLAPCDDCLQELFTPADRRYGYPFINCTACGPRYSLVARLPYDRANTSMAAFPMCPACAAEYHNPLSRRFHAQPNACPDCGPQLWAESVDAPAVKGTRAALQQALAVIRCGGIVAMRGVGGFHLVCDASNPEAIARLRQRKQRPGKPLAVMLANTASLTGWVEVDGAELALTALASQAAPVVILPQAADSAHEAALQQLAPGLDALGVMLPQSPLHWLLFHEAAGAPGGRVWATQTWPLALVMTSANRSGEPLITDNAQARQQLAGIADLWLCHDREILVREDDSVLAALTPEHGLLAQRIGRGLAPLRLPLPASLADAPVVLALGSYLKNTVALNAGTRLLVSQHVGDLDHPDNCAALRRTVEQLLALLQVRPQRIACDLHPEGYGSLLARQLAEQYQVPLLEVPHHVAHVAAVAAEYGCQRPLLGLALDGFGLGWDGQSRGGELLRVESDAFVPLGALLTLPQPGADAAAREPWRMAAGLLEHLGQRHLISAWLGPQVWPQQVAAPALAMTSRMLERQLNCPPTSSAGRLFDAVAGLLGVCYQQSYEGEAAMRLETLARAAGAPDFEPPPRALWVLRHGGGQCQLDLDPLLRHLLQQAQQQGVTTDPAQQARLARLFHQQLVAALADWLQLMAAEQRLDTIALAGGCFQNALLRRWLPQALAMNPDGRQLQVLLPRQIPVNDAGVAVGQLWYALACPLSSTLPGG